MYTLGLQYTFKEKYQITNITIQALSNNRVFNIYYK